MRVISGLYKGKKLESPNGNDVRPTTDRIKESMFNILFSRITIEDTTVLDLFCGSGALGIEALSRGAKKTVFCDKNSQSIELAKKNLNKLGAKNFETYVADYAFALKKLEGRKFDIIFIDPPYKEGFAYNAIHLILKSGILEANGVIVAEHASEEQLKEIEGIKYDCRKMGATSLTFCSFK